MKYMRIVKRITDYDLNEGQQILAEFIEQNGECAVCSQKILNPEFLSEYIRPKHDFLIYTNAQPGAEARRIIR